MRFSRQQEARQKTDKSKRQKTKYCRCCCNKTKGIMARIHLPSLTTMIPLARIVVITFILIGLILVTWRVTMEYFLYKTTSLVAIRDYPDEVVAPAVILCVRFKIDPKTESKVSRYFTSNILNDKNDDWKITKLWSEVITDKPLDHEVKKYLKGNKYCLFVKVKNKFIMEEVTSDAIELPKFYGGILSTQPFQANVTLGLEGKKCRPKIAYFQVVTDESAISSKKNPYFIRPICTTCKKEYVAGLSYTTSISIKLPPPHDTNCLDYHDQLSSHNCYDECLKKQTSPFKVVPGMTVIDRKTYLNSTMDIIQSNLIQGTDKLVDNSTLPAELLTSYQVIRSQWKGMKDFCHGQCNRPDCVSERITPIMSFIASAGPEKDKNTKMGRIRFVLRTSDQPILQVLSVPKQQFLDYVVYMSSCLSFWLGFCPLTIARWIEEKVKKNLRKRRVCPRPTFRVRRIKNAWMSRSLGSYTEYNLTYL